MNLPKYFQIPIIALVVMGTLFVGVLTWNAIETHSTIGRPADVRDTITISGEGVVTSRPDIARMQIGVMTEARDVVEAQRQNTEKTNAIIDSFSSFGIEEKDIKTSNYQIYPRYDYNDGRQILRGYQITQTVSIKIRDLSKVGDVLARAGQLGANQVDGITFDIDDPAQLEREAREKAILDAGEKAKALARSLGVRLGSVVGFSEGGSSGVPMPMYRSYAEDMAMGSAESVPSPSIQSGSYDITKNVNIVFEIK